MDDLYLTVPMIYNELLFDALNALFTLVVLKIAIKLLSLLDNILPF